MVFLFRDKSIINLFFLALLCIGVHTHLFMVAPVVFSHTDDGVFSFFLKQYIVGLPQTVLVVLYLGIVFFQAIRLNLILNNFRMFPQNTYVPAMTFILLTGIIPQWSSISSAMLANFLLLWLFARLSKLYNNPSPKTLLFNTGLIIGLSVICYHPTALLIIVVLLALMEVRPFNTAEWVVLLMGIVLPYYFLFSWFFLKDQLSHFLSYLPSVQLTLPLQHWSENLVFDLSFLLIVLLLGLYYWQVFNQRMVIQIRKNWGMMATMLVILLPIPFIFTNSGIESAFMALVPIAVFSSNAFSFPRRLVLPKLLFWLSVVLIAYNNWVFIKN